MSGLGRLARVAAAKLIANQTPATFPTNSFAGLTTASPDDDGQGGTEPTIGTNGYARASITWTAVATPAVDGNVVLTNSNALTFTSTGGGFSTGATPLTHVPVYTGSTLRTEATYVGYGPLTPSQAVNAAGVTITIPIGSLQITIGQANTTD